MMGRAPSKDADVPDPLPGGERVRIFLYLGCLSAVISFSDPSGGLMDVPMSFLLKNQLHLEAHELASFRLLASLPLYLSFGFGFFRDVWSSHIIRDRTIIGLFSLISAILYVILALVPVSYTTLLLASLLPTMSFLFVSSAQGGLSALLGQQHAMSGQISAVWNVSASLPAAAAFVIGGHVSQFLEYLQPGEATRILFSIGALSSIVVFTFCFLRPRSVYDNVVAENGVTSASAENLQRLLRHWPVYPAMAIWLLWNFSPGSVTPLQYYLQNSLGATDSKWGLWNAIFTLSFLPGFLAYGFLSTRFRLKKLLWWGTMFAIPQFVPLLLVDTLDQAMVVAVPLGLTGGIATAAYLDLIIRSCPRGLQGTTVMMSGGFYFLSTRLSDVLGTYLYDNIGGFKICVLVMATTYICIPFVLLLVPEEVQTQE